MSECVVRMEMPKGCYSCPFKEATPEWWCCELHDSYTPIRGQLPMDRPSWCPIICSLPEGHGRLVDMRDIDSMMEDASSTSDESGLYSLVYRDDLDFDGLPTIVPAERREKDGR